MKQRIRPEVQTVGDPPKHRMEAILDAIKKSNGIQANIAKRLGVTRACVSNWVNGIPEIWDAVHEAREATIDLAEDSLIKNIRARDNTATIFYLKCQGKERGYIERQEISVSGSMRFQNMTDEELQASIDKKLQNLPTK